MELLNKEVITRHSPLIVQLPIKDFSMIAVPGYQKARMGTCYVRITDLPAALSKYTEVNPRSPSRTKSGNLRGPVVKAIMNTLLNNPNDLSLVNRGMFVLVKSVVTSKGSIKLVLTDRNSHGIVDGLHTFAAIREAIENATPEQLGSLKNAFVKLHIFENIDKNIVAHIAEGLNRSRQVDDLSLVNLQGQFDRIRKVLKGKKGAEHISYHQGDSGEVYISDILVMMYLFDRSRWDEHKAPNILYNKSAVGLRLFKEDIANNPKNVEALLQLLPDILVLGDHLKKLIPDAAKANKFKYGMVKTSGGRTSAQVYLPFLDETMDYRIPRGWQYPILSAFRANLTDAGKWVVPLDVIVPATINSLVSVLVAEHRYGNSRPEIIGKQESAYNACYAKIQLYLAKAGKI